MLPIARERGAVADKLFAGAVPAELMRALAARGEKIEPELRDRWQKNGRKTSGTWAQVFGDDEWGAGSFHRLALRALRRGARGGGQEALRHPDVRERGAQSHRPQARRVSERWPAAASLDVWKAGAPTPDMLCARHLLPELRAARRALQSRRTTCCSFPKPTTRRIRRVRRTRSYSFGELDSLGFSPFSIESLGDAPNALSQCIRSARSS